MSSRLITSSAPFLEGWRALVPTGEGRRGGVWKGRGLGGWVDVARPGLAGPSEPGGVPGFVYRLLFLFLCCSIVMVLSSVPFAGSHMSECFFFICLWADPRSMLFVQRGHRKMSA